MTHYLVTCRTRSPKGLWFTWTTWAATRAEAEAEVRWHQQHSTDVRLDLVEGPELLGAAGRRLVARGRQLPLFAEQAQP